MAIDNSLYDSLQNTYIGIKNYLDKVQLGREHSLMIVKHEELAELLEIFDIEVLEEQSKDIHALHKQLDEIKEISHKILEDLDTNLDSTDLAPKVAHNLDEIFSEISIKLCCLK
ncbi:MAG: hypothetical protein Q9M40_11510 [Sulfurimonas sp.]|nr:hypothetical protein [Sulfurimonas sp.]